MKAKLLHGLKLRGKQLKKAIKPYFFRIYPFRLKQYVGNNQLLIRTKYGFLMYTFGNDMSSSGFPVVFCGIWEPHLTSLLYQKSKPGIIAFDIGANVGYFSALFASKNVYVHAFEPNPVMSEMIYKNIFINNVSSLIKNELEQSKSVVNQCAVGRSRGTVKMEVNSHMTGNTSLKKETFSELGKVKSIEVDIITLDEYAEINNLQNVDIIKIDVEGFEEEALRGAANLIRRSPDLMLCMEYTRGCYSNDFLPWLEKLFSKVYLPQFNQQIDFEFLRKYQESKVLYSEGYLDVVLIRGHQFA
ncbi:MAG: FkbM family methyltransferase [Cyanobacteria bacterium MAG CAR1_bin_15]|nr:FkbM family methyltransferase [Cyanobacteria bacterium MAG CAR1_bin_15]